MVLIGSFNLVLLGLSIMMAVTTDRAGASVNATIEERAGRIKASAREIVSVTEDFRMQAIGGAIEP